jgi:cardiolipin synthase
MFHVITRTVALAALTTSIQEDGHESPIAKKVNGSGYRHGSGTLRSASDAAEADDVGDLGTALTIVFAVYALGMSIFLIIENRRPQATLAWMLIFFMAPVVGAMIYVLFGRERKAFSKRSSLLRQDLSGHARPLLSPILAAQDAEIAALEHESPGYRKLMVLVRRNSRSALTRHNRVDIKQNAAEFYPSLLKDLSAALHSIHLQYFIWSADSVTSRITQVLAAKAKAGVEVRLLFDPLGSRAHLPRSQLEEMQALGIRVAPTSPLWRLHTISYRNHRKITVIDGRIGYTGGMNIGREHVDGGKGFSFWRDTQVRIVGQGATALQAVFAVDWYNAVREDLFSPAYFPAAPHTGQDENVPVQILTSGPDSEWAAIRQVYFSMIVSAQRHVYLQSPYFILDASLAEALTSAALTGVDVKVMITARPSGDPVPGWAGNTFILDVINAGVRVFLYQKGYLHAKTITVDSEACSIGSANIDIRSFSINYEITAVLYSRTLAAQLEQDFERDLVECTEFDPAEYRKRPVAIRFRDSVARLFSPLL